MGRLRRGTHPVDRERRVVDGRVAVAGGVLDGAAGQARPDGQLDRPPDLSRVVGEAVLEVGGDRHIDRVDERRAVREDLVTRHRAVEPAERRRESRARGGDGLEAEGRKQLGRSLVPRVRLQQRCAGGVQRQEMACGRSRHGPSLARFRARPTG